MKRFVSTKVSARASKVHRGFTLVELLVVIAIIGLLVGLLVPAVQAVRGSFNKSAVKFEVQALSDAVEQYRSKYGDYPPDGSSWPVMETHLRKAFPDILISELNLLNPAMNALQSGSTADIRNDNDTSLSAFASDPTKVIHCRVMDSAEALVFFLGGFSSDKQRPFTGPGGPFLASTASGQKLQYNPSRQNSFFEFPSNRLTLDIVNGATISTDEALFGESVCQTGTGRDLLPVFVSKLSESTLCPYVYFDSRTYQTTKPGVTYFNFFQPSAITVPSGTGRGLVGAARPILSETLNTVTSRLFYENKTSFQVLSPGVDGRFGGRIASEVSSPSNLILFTSKANPCSLNGVGFTKNGGTRLVLPEHVGRPMQDDAANVINLATLGDNSNDL